MKIKSSFFFLQNNYEKSSLCSFAVFTLKIILKVKEEKLSSTLDFLIWADWVIT